MGELRKRLAKNMRRLRGDTPQRDFAKRLGITKSTLHRIENYEQNVGLDTLELICKRLKCEIADIFSSEKG